MIEYQLLRPGQLDRENWQQLQALQRRAYGFMLDRSPQEIDYLMRMDDSDKFYASHRFPNTLVGERVSPGNSFHHARVALASRGNKPVGFAYAAHNVSGENAIERFGKRLLVTKDYLWLREVAVEPEYGQKGIAHRLGTLILEDARLVQKPVTYIWPDETEYIVEPLKQLGFSETDQEWLPIFGDAVKEVRQVRMQAPSVRVVLENLYAWEAKNAET